MEEQHKGLKRQARQASRYRNLSDHIHRAEATVLALKLANAERDLAESSERLKEAEAQVADLTRLVGLATTAQAEEPVELDTAPTVSVVGRLPLLSVVLGQAYELAVHGLDLVRRVSARHPECDILVITIFGDEESVVGALEAGARGYLLKGALEHDIADDIRQGLGQIRLSLEC